MTDDTKKEEAERILKAARKQVFAHGVRSLQLDKLATKLSMRVKTIYTHYRTKSLLIAAVLRDKMTEMDSDLDVIHKTNHNFSESMRLMLEVLRKHALEYSPVYVRDMMAKGSTRYFDWMVNLREEILTRHLTEFFELGQQEGAIRDDISVTIFNEAYLSMTNGILIGKIIRKEKGSNVHEVHKTLFSMLLKGVLVRCEPKRKPAPPKKKKTTARKKA